MHRTPIDEWFSLRRREQGVSLIGEPHINAFYRRNIGHVIGRNADLLVDSGM